MKRKLRITVAFLLFSSFSFCAAFWFKIYNRPMPDLVYRSHESVFDNWRHAYFYVDGNEIQKNPERAAEKAILGHDWRLLLGPKYEQIEGVECSLGDWTFSTRSMVSFETTNITAPQAQAEAKQTWSNADRRIASNFARFNRRIVKDLRNPLRPFCKSGHHTISRFLNERRPSRLSSIRTWQILTELPPQNDLLEAARANQTAQTKRLRLPNNVYYDFLGMTVLSWAAAHGNHALLARVAQYQGDAYCRSLQPDYRRATNPNIKGPVQWAIVSGDTVATKLLMQILSSPACNRREDESSNRGSALNGALYQAEQRGPSMILAVIQGFQPTDGEDTGNLAGPLREKGYIAAARIAASRWGIGSWLYSAAERCDPVEASFWLNAGRASQHELNSARNRASQMEANRLERASALPIELTKTNHDCSRTIALIDSALTQATGAALATQ